MAAVYALIDPAQSDEIRYVGVTKGCPEARRRAHVSEALRRDADGSWRLPANHRRCWIRSLVAAGRRPEVRLLATVEDSARRDAERIWIASVIALGHRLTNATAGGEGPENYKPLDAAKLRNSLSQRLRFCDPAEVERQRCIAQALWADPAYRKRVSEGVRQAWAAAPERRQTVGQAILARRDALAHRQACAAYAASPRGLEAQRRTSERMRGELNPVARLTWERVRAIREIYANGSASQRRLAEQFEVSQALISLVVRHKIWLEQVDHQAGPSTEGAMW
jgi:hypothetical protein